MISNKQHMYIQKTYVMPLRIFIEEIVEICNSISDVFKRNVITKFQLKVLKSFIAHSHDVYAFVNWESRNFFNKEIKLSSMEIISLF